MFMNVIWADAAICLTCLPKTHVACARRGGHLCCYVWLANWFHVLWFHLVYVYSQIRFNYVFHATIGIQARSQHMMYNKWCYLMSEMLHVEANVSVCVFNTWSEPRQVIRVWDVGLSGTLHGFRSWFRHGRSPQWSPHGCPCYRLMLPANH